MAKIKELGKDARGNHVRNLGWKLTETGGRVQQRYYLGKDSEEAHRRNARLEELWAVIEGEADSFGGSSDFMRRTMTALSCFMNATRCGPSSGGGRRLNRWLSSSSSRAEKLSG